MSRHRIVHTFDANDIVSEFDGDDYDEEGEDELSPEDRQAMEDGTAEVRRVLGTEANKVTKTQIEEALWHYYYDIDKSVTYLMKTFIAPAPKPVKKAPEGMSVYFPASRRLLGTGADHGRLSDGYTSDMNLPPINKVPACFFNDMPWLNVPQERQTLFVAPERPRGGLLGGGEGAPKMSKLQALAAARKKKTEEKKEQEKVEKGISNLSVAESKKENQSPFVQRHHISTPAPQVHSPHHEKEIKHEYTAEDNKHETSTSVYKDELMLDSLPEVEVVSQPNPSAFARTLFGSAPANTHRPDVFAMPYTSSPSFTAQAFAEPSPDDIVFAAQAKGSNFTRTK
jgi:elongation factor 1 alpha-like protein